MFCGENQLENPMPYTKPVRFSGRHPALRTPRNSVRKPGKPGPNDSCRQRGTVQSEEPRIIRVPIWKSNLGRRPTTGGVTIFYFILSGFPRTRDDKTNEHIWALVSPFFLFCPPSRWSLDLFICFAAIFAVGPRNSRASYLFPPVSL